MGETRTTALPSGLAFFETKKSPPFVKKRNPHGMAVLAGRARELVRMLLRIQKKHTAATFFAAPVYFSTPGNG